MLLIAAVVLALSTGGPHDVSAHSPGSAGHRGAGGAPALALDAPWSCYTDECIEALVCSQPWPCREALDVAFCESRFDPWAFNAGNYGIYQINQVHAARVNGDLQRLFDAETNVRVAYELYRDSGGWGPWACKPG